MTFYNKTGDFSLDVLVSSSYLSIRAYHPYTRVYPSVISNNLSSQGSSIYSDGYIRSYTHTFTSLDSALSYYEKNFFLYPDFFVPKSLSFEICSNPVDITEVVINDGGSFVSVYDCYYTSYELHVLSFSISSCCYPDFSPILEFLGGTPSDNQLSNLKGICSLLEVDTSENGLKNCDLMKEYLKRLTPIFGGVSSSEPNENLKSICDLLGVQTTENDLKECELSKYYVKQISNMLRLRGENA